MQCSNNFGHCLDFGWGVVFSPMLLLFPFFQCSCCCLCNTPVVFVIVLSLFQFWCCPLCNALADLFIVLILVFDAVAVFLFGFWYCCLQYLIPDLVLLQFMTNYYSYLVNDHIINIIVIDSIPKESAKFGGFSPSHISRTIQPISKSNRSSCL